MATTRVEKKSSVREKFKDGEMCAVVSRVEMKGNKYGGKVGGRELKRLKLKAYIIEKRRKTENFLFAP